MSRELYIYWKVDAADGPAASAALREFHARLALTGCQARLLVRADTVDDQLTLLEVYAFAGGAAPSAERQQRLVAEGDALTQRWRRGPRHVEVFETIA